MPSINSRVGPLHQKVKIHISAAIASTHANKKNTPAQQTATIYITDTRIVPLSGLLAEMINGIGTTSHPTREAQACHLSRAPAVVVGDDILNTPSATIQRRCDTVVVSSVHMAKAYKDTCKASPIFFACQSDTPRGDRDNLHRPERVRTPKKMQSDS